MSPAQVKSFSARMTALAAASRGAKPAAPAPKQDTRPVAPASFGPNDADIPF
jgi:hypothetical protein